MFENYSWHKDLPSEDLEVYEPHLKLFFETMYERQMIWKRRFLENLGPRTRFLSHLNLPTYIGNLIETLSGKSKTFFLMIS